MSEKAPIANYQASVNPTSLNCSCQPSLRMAWDTLATSGLIFGGCCSNVFALEAVLQHESDSGLLITFCQFVVAALAAAPAVLGRTKSVKTTKGAKERVPQRRWMTIAFLFFAINMLNNWAFAFRISVPMHIILRSFGSVITMLVGVWRGKRFKPTQIAGVVVLTVGVVVSAWADAEAKGKRMKLGGTSQGLLLLLVAQLLGAYMGVYVEETYSKYQASWKENLFYSHALSLPLFLPLASVLQGQWRRLAATHPITITGNTTRGIPAGTAWLVVNAVTQLACITGVNVLSAQSSAVTVTVVLNMRKLASFVLSAVAFGHDIGGLLMTGALLVFGGGGLYGW
ncbi:UAA transporter [Piedraia hortae CBS 480.64]|uniref:UAA transporter n=1 Tax=Piedraia hortae CBS 480.64 TaxID=1314780 RepID=A0A6A7BZJ2_9PEZI|nr:UAA transporter [Piedraia hortae CBS 480.64]